MKEWREPTQAFAKTQNEASRLTNIPPGTLATWIAKGVYAREPDGRYDLRKLWDIAGQRARRQQDRLEQEGRSRDELDRKRRIERQILELKLAERRGELLSRASVVDYLRGLLEAQRTHLGNLPRRAAAIVCPDRLAWAEDELHRLCQDVLDRIRAQVEDIMWLHPGEGWQPEQEGDGDDDSVD
jgi:hypothetical protein